MRRAIRSGSCGTGPFAPAPFENSGQAGQTRQADFRPALDCKSHADGEFRGTRNY
jgi:hypothetical protein